MGPGSRGRIPGDVTVVPHREVGVARVEPDDGRVGRERLPLGNGVRRGVSNGFGGRSRGGDLVES